MDQVDNQMKNLINRWKSENAELLLNPRYPGVFKLVKYLQTFTGVTSADLYQNSMKELIAMNFRDNGKFSVCLYYNQLLDKIDVINSQAATESEKLITNSDLRTVIVRSFSSSKLLIEKLATMREKFASVMRDIQELDSTL
jgi:hypothetical protein